MCVSEWTYGFISCVLVNGNLDLQCELMNGHLEVLHVSW